MKIHIPKDFLLWAGFAPHPVGPCSVKEMAENLEKSFLSGNVEQLNALTDDYFARMAKESAGPALLAAIEEFAPTLHANVHKGSDGKNENKTDTWIV